MPTRPPRVPTLAPRFKPLLLASAIACLAGAAFTVQAEQAAAVESRINHYAITAQPLDAAILDWSAISGIQLFADATLTRGLTSSAVQGDYSASAALTRMLQGTGLSFRMADSSRAYLEKPSASEALQLGATTVQGQALGDITENSGSYTTGAVAVGSKVAKSLREVPHSVSVITRQRMEDQNINSLTEAMDKMTGVTHSQAGRTAGSSVGNDSNFYSRGFQVNNVLLDGGAPLDTVMVGFGSVSQLDMAQFDHVEFLRGVDGLYSGSGDPGGTINLVRKRALDHNQVTFSTSAGSWDNYRSELDVTGPLTSSGNVRGRLGMAYQDRKYFYDPGNMKTKVLYGSMEFDIAPDTLLTVGGSYQEMEGVSNFAGLPRYADGRDLKLSRRTVLTPDWNTTEETTRQAFFKLQHDFNEDWGLTLDAVRMEMDRDAMTAFTAGAVRPDTLTGNTFFAFPAKTGMDRTGFSATLKGGFDLFDRHHELILGGDYQKGNAWTEQRTVDANGTQINVFDPVFPAKDQSYPNSDDYHITKKKALFAMTRLSLTDALKLSIGGRVADYSYENNSPYFDRDGNQYWEQGLRELQDNGVFTPYAGLTYDLDETWTVYTSYAETFRPQYQQVTREGGKLDPVESTNYEAGLKGQFLDGRLNASLAIYRAEQKNVAVKDSTSGTSYTGYLCCYVNQGETVSQGIDAEVSGEIASGWQLMAGYTYNHSRDKDSSTANYRNITPKHLFKVWSTYQLPGRLNDWKVGGGAIAQSSNFVSGTTYEYNDQTGDFDKEGPQFKFLQAGYVIWSGSLDYRIDEHWSATFNANNVLDKRYYQTVGDTQAGNFYGEPRNFTLTLRSKF